MRNNSLNWAGKTDTKLHSVESLEMSLFKIQNLPLPHGRPHTLVTGGFRNLQKSGARGTNRDDWLKVCTRNRLSRSLPWSCSTGQLLLLFQQRARGLFWKQRKFSLGESNIHLSVKTRHEIMGVKWKPEILESQFIPPVKREFLTEEIYKSKKNQHRVVESCGLSPKWKSQITSNDSIPGKPCSHPSVANQFLTI